MQGQRSGENLPDPKSSAFRLWLANSPSLQSPTQQQLLLKHFSYFSVGSSRRKRSSVTQEKERRQTREIIVVFEQQQQNRGETHAMYTFQIQFFRGLSDEFLVLLLE